MKKLLRLAAGVLLAAGLTSAASAALLTDLLNGGSLTIGDKIFSDFTWGGAPGSAAGVTIDAIGDGTANNLYGIQIQGPGVLTQNGSGSTDLRLGYSVQATGGFLVSDIHQYVTLVGSPGSSAVISEDALDGPGGLVVAHSTVGKVFSSSDLEDPPAELFDVLDLATPLEKVWIKKDIVLSVPSTEPDGYIDVAVIQQRFSQVPEPTTVIAGALLLLPLGASSIRILRKKA